MNNIGLQLWTVRDWLNKSPQQCIAFLAAQGIKHVETFDLQQAKKLKPICDDQGIKISSSFILWSHISQNWSIADEINYPWLPKDKSLASVFELANTLGIDHLVNGYFHPTERQTFTQWQQLTEQLESAALLAKQFGIQLCYHNHGFEFELTTDKNLNNAIHQKHTNGYQYLIANTDQLGFELDLMWAYVSGQNPAQLIQQLSTRLKLLHFKDSLYAGNAWYDDQTLPHELFCAVGQGNVLTTQTLKAVKQALTQPTSIKISYIEQDYSQQLQDDITKSFKYLTSL